MSVKPIDTIQRIALVTGTSTGLGTAIAIKLAQAGHTVYATMRNTEKQEALLAAASKANVELQVRSLDVQDAASIQTCVNDIIATHGRIDLLVNNAGAGLVRTTELASEEDVQWVMDINFHGVVRCVKAVLPHMRKARSGHIINISSVGGLVGQPFSDFYCAAKFAVEGLTESLAAYVGPAFNIQFTNVEPGGITTEFASNVMQRMSETGGMPTDDYAPLMEKFLASGAGTPREGLYQSADEVAQVVMTCVNQKNPPLRTRTSAWSETFCALKTAKDPTGKLLQQQVFNEFMA